MYRSILVPLDGSTFAEHALPLALALAKRSRARLYLVTVSTPLAEAYVEGMYFSTLELEQELTARHHHYLETVSNRLRQKNEISVKTAVLHGEVASTLAEVVTQGEADLVVMATHGRGAIGRFWLGSVADEMIRQAHVPLLLVRPNGGTADLSKEPDLSRIVLPLDGSELAEQILGHAAKLAKIIPGAEIILLRAIQALVPVEATPDVPEAEKAARGILHQVQALQTRLRQEAESYLEEIAARLRANGLKVRIQVVVEDQPAVAILEEAETVQAGLIALETHGRTGLSRLIHGSVADKVVRGSHIPVLVHRPLEG